MVNTGKPSRGCYMCRARRIKCDEGKPHCMRCQKSKRQCPGYRDAFELKLRDESKSTKKKMNRRLNQQQLLSENIINNGQSSYGPQQAAGFSGIHSRSTSLSSTSSSFSGFMRSHSRSISSSSNFSQDSSSSQNGSVVRSHPHNVIALHMTTPIQQQAACYFLSNFVLVPESGTMRGYLDFVLPLMKPKTPQTSLTYAFAAVTLAALGTRPNSKALASTSDLWYLKALKEINAALKDPRLASSEATLASVMLMASFEQIAPARITVAGWSSHIDGAVAMIKSCPIQRWKTGIGRDLFVAVRAHHTLQCIANSRAVDPDIDWMSIDDYDNIIHTFAAANLKMSVLRADNDKTTSLKAHTTENVEKVLKLLRRAESLDQEYIDWIKALPASWAIKTVAWIDGEVPDLATSVIHPGRVDTYGELWMAYKYNIVRACRLFTWTVILRCVAWLGVPRDYRLTPEYTTASRICQSLVEDIVSSVPYFFGWNRDKDAAMVDKSTFACGANDYSTVKPLAGLFAMWPLFSAASSDFASPTQRIFLRGRLKHIAEMMGINQATVMLQAQLVHPSLYIARERMNLVPTSCNSTDSQVKIVKGVPSVAFAALTPPQEETITQTESTETEEPAQVAESSQPPEETWQPPPPTTRHELWTYGASQPKFDDTWQPPSLPQQTSWHPATPPHEQLWSASTSSPPHEQLWNASTSSPPHDTWKTSSPPHNQNHLWSPASDSHESWSSIPTTINPNSNTNTITTDTSTYDLPITVPQEQFWHQQQEPPPITTSLSYSGDITSHDPGQVWSIGFDDPAGNWTAKTAADHLDVLHGTLNQPPMMGARAYENERRFSEGVGV